MRKNPVEIESEEFRKIGYKLIDDITEFINHMDEKPVTYSKSPRQIQEKLNNGHLPEKGMSAHELMNYATDLLFNNSLFNGHPKFMGYITSSATPIGMLADLLAASLNPNVGAHILSPVASEIEKQTVQWLAEFIGVSSNYGGILVSGGNMANFTAFLAGRTAKAPKSIIEEGMSSSSQKLTVYCSKTTHTWIEKAVVLFGLGTNSIRWIPADSYNKMKNDVLEETILEDIKKGYQPMMIIGTAGDVSTGAVDDLNQIGLICEKYNLWFHIDGAYGIPAAIIPEMKDLFDGLEKADSIALDPHKWLYSPLEAGCTLVKNPKHLTDTFSTNPEYYNFRKDDGEFAQNFYEYGLQNSRGFRALKVWLALKQIGREGYEKLISEDIQLAKLLYSLADDHPNLQAISHNLSITTLRYVPNDKNWEEDYLNELNKALLDELQQGGEVFLSNAIVEEKYCLRACIVNFRTDQEDIHEIVNIIVNRGKLIHIEFQQSQ